MASSSISGNGEGSVGDRKLSEGLTMLVMVENISVAENVQLGPGWNVSQTLLR